MKKEKEIKVVKINTEFITLGQFLKFENLISNGGEAKNFILKNNIKLNNASVNERGKKIYPKMIISINDSMFFEIQNDN